MTEKDARNIVMILNKFQDNYAIYNAPFLMYKELFSFLSASEQETLRRIVPVKMDASAVNGYVQLTDAEGGPPIMVQKKIKAAFEEMMVSCLKYTKETITIISGYRSPAYQSLIFLRELYNHDFDRAATLSLVKLPSDSEHCFQMFHAVDLSTTNLNGTIESFASSLAFGWLKTEAQKYHFWLSYPEHNNQSMAFEPWHWLYKE